MLNILTEPLIRINTSGGTRAVSLPELYALLLADDVEAFPALRPHQRHAWHAFLVQLGAMTLHRAGVSEPPTDAAEWAGLIRNLTPDWPDDEPWQLVVDDITKPAFMQPPASRWADYNKKALFLTPDALDMLDTAKSHDIKTSVAIAANAEDWMVALVAMQTMNGQVGRGNYPIARMNSGDGSRTAFSITPYLHPGGHVRRDVLSLLHHASEVTNDLPLHWDGVGLLWTKRWDGKNSEALLLSDLHPFYIEICRRRRLRIDDDDRLYAMKAGSAGRRIAAAENRGIVGDPWTLVDYRDKKGQKALTLPEGGFTYKRVTDYLTSPGDWGAPLLSQPIQSERDRPVTHLMMRGVRRKKGGQTEGYHERTILIRKKTMNAMLRRNASRELAELGDISKARVEQVGIVQRILSHAIQVFVARGDDSNVKQEHRNKARSWLNRLDEIVDAGFFDALQDEFEQDDRAERERSRNTWLMNGKDGVVDHARNILQEAADSLPCPAIHRYKALENAQGLFEGRLRGSGGLPFLFDDNRESNA